MREFDEIDFSPVILGEPVTEPNPFLVPIAVEPVFEVEVDFDGYADIFNEPTREWRYDDGTLQSLRG